MPEQLKPTDAAPLLCAGLTTFNALRNSGARPGDVVAVLGLGGLGHLGVQYAAKMGFRTVGIARGKDKESLARELGADQYIDSTTQDPAAELQKLGGAKAILATATSGDAMSAVEGGLAINGTMLVIGAAPSMQVSPLFLLTGCRSVKGWYSGTSIDSEDTLAFSARTGVRSMNEVYPARKSPRRLRTHAERQSAISRRADDGKVGRPGNFSRVPRLLRSVLLGPNVVDRDIRRARQVRHGIAAKNCKAVALEQIA